MAKPTAELSVVIDTNLVLDQLPENAKREIQRVLQIEEADLAAALGRLATAGLAELLQMVAVQPMPRTASEIRQFRLFCLARFWLSGRPPNEVDIARLFRIRRNEARRLIEDSRLRFPALDRPFYKSVVEAITKYPQHGKGDVKFESVGGDIFQAVSEYALATFPQEKQPWKDEKTGAVYFIPGSIYAEVLKHFEQLAQ